MAAPDELDQHPFLTARHVDDLNATFRAVNATQLRMERIMRDQLSVMREFSRHAGELVAIRQDIASIREVLVRATSNGQGHLDPDGT
jgi:hypothetical protein